MTLKGVIHIENYNFFMDCKKQLQAIERRIKGISETIYDTGFTFIAIGDALLDGKLRQFVQGQNPLESVDLAGGLETPAFAAAAHVQGVAVHARFESALSSIMRFLLCS